MDEQGSQIKHFVMHMSSTGKDVYYVPNPDTSWSNERYCESQKRKYIEAIEESEAAFTAMIKVPHEGKATDRLRKQLGKHGIDKLSVTRIEDGKMIDYVYLTATPPKQMGRSKYEVIEFISEEAATEHIANSLIFDPEWPKGSKTQRVTTTIKTLQIHSKDAKDKRSEQSEWQRIQGSIREHAARQVRLGYEVHTNLNGKGFESSPAENPSGFSLDPELATPTGKGEAEYEHPELYYPELGGQLPSNWNELYDLYDRDFITDKNKLDVTS